MRVALVILLVVFSPRAASAQDINPSSTHKSAPNVQLRLIPETATIRPGERLKLRVELWNVGSDDVIIAQKVDATFGNSQLQFFLEAGSLREAGPGMAADGIPEPNPDFEKTFVTNWLTLNHGHFYGTYVYLDPIDFPHLRKEGHYGVRAEYYSRGISSTPGWNGGYLRQEDVDKLPLQSLTGTIDSNVVRIRVASRKLQKK
jgi:hypothetical protein